MVPEPLVHSGHVFELFSVTWGLESYFHFKWKPRFWPHHLTPGPGALKKIPNITRLVIKLWEWATLLFINSSPNYYFYFMIKFSLLTNPCLSLCLLFHCVVLFMDREYVFLRVPILQSADPYNCGNPLTYVGGYMPLLDWDVVFVMWCVN